MWTGDTHSQGGSYPTQWALNPTAYVNVPNEQVDWASLAQQWIKMKEGLPPTEKEGGEAPMEITKEESLPPATSPPVAAPTTSWPANQPINAVPESGVWQNNWGWDQGGGWCWSGMSDTKIPTPPSYPPGYTTVPEPAAPTTTPPVTPQPPFHYTPQPAANQHYSSNPGYWTENSSIKETWESNSTRSSRKQSTVQEAVPELDSAKRKQLPAWIREGLEKMEREKQKKAENERLERQRHEEMVRQQEEEAQNNILEANGSPALPKKSKFETDSEESEVEKELISDKSVEKTRKSRFDWRGPEPSPPPPKPIFRTKEEILQYVMKEVRKILTSLLMEVTNEEMRSAAEEVHSHFQRKAPATTVRKTQALASLTGKLGLGIYDSDSGSENSESEGAAVNGADSDLELRERIKRRKEDFLDTEERIDREVAESEEKERRVLLGKNSVSREVSPETEEQVQPTQQGAVYDSKSDRKIITDNEDLKAIEIRENKSEIKSQTPVNRDRYESKKETDKSSQRKSERRVRKQSTSSSSSSGYSRSPSPYRRRKHSKHKKERRCRRSRTKSRSRSKDKSRSRSRGWSPDRSRDRKHRRKDKRYRSRSPSKRRRSSDRRRYRSSSSSSGGPHNKKSCHRR